MPPWKNRRSKTEWKREKERERERERERETTSWELRSKGEERSLEKDWVEKAKGSPLPLYHRSEKEQRIFVSLKATSSASVLPLSLSLFDAPQHGTHRDSFEFYSHDRFDEGSRNWNWLRDGGSNWMRGDDCFYRCPGCNCDWTMHDRLYFGDIRGIRVLSEWD